MGDDEERMDARSVRDRAERHEREAWQAEAREAAAQAEVARLVRERDDARARGVGGTGAPMRVRCPVDDGTVAHLAFDVRMPAPVCNALGALAKLRCACGKALVIVTGPEVRR